MQIATTFGPEGTALVKPLRQTTAHRRLSWVVVTALSICGQAFADPPATEFPLGPSAKTLEALRKVVNPGDDRSFRGSFVRENQTVTSHVDGSNPEETDTTAEVSVADGGRSEKIVKQAGSNANGGVAIVNATPGTDASDEAVHSEFPNPDNANRFEFGPLIRDGSLSIANFRPAEGLPNAENLTRGQIAWNSQTLDPTWIEWSPVKAPKHVKIMKLRMELERTSGQLVVTRITTDVVVSVLFYSRRLHTDTRYTHIRPNEGGAR